MPPMREPTETLIPMCQVMVKTPTSTMIAMSTGEALSETTMSWTLTLTKEDSLSKFWLDLTLFCELFIKLL